MVGADRRSAAAADEASVPLLREEIDETPPLFERVQQAKYTLRDQWMKLSGFLFDPRAGDWATQGGPRPEGAK